MIATDFLLDPITGDLMIQNGDFVTGPSDQQHIQDTINAFPGWWKQFPGDGVGVLNYLNSSGDSQQLAREIIIQLQSDGYTVSTPVIDITADGINISPNAIRKS